MDDIHVTSIADECGKGTRRGPALWVYVSKRKQKACGKSGNRTKHGMRKKI